MIIPPQKSLLNLSKKSGFSTNGVEKIIRVADILEYIGACPWNKKFVINDASALNLFYMEPSRLVNDIDIYYVADLRNYNESDRDNIRNLLPKSIAVKGYTLTKEPSRDEEYGLIDSFTFAFTYGSGVKDSIKININYYNGELVLKSKSLNINNSIVKASMPISLVDTTEIMACKIANLLEKPRPTDLYDVYRLITSCAKHDLKLIKKCVIFYNSVWGKGDLINNDFSILDKIVKASVTKMLKPLLSQKDTFDFITAIKEVKAYLKNLLVLENSEKEFITNFLNKKYNPGLLFEQTDILVRINKHPMALFKCSN
jgi:predicted nucleotidyltransferase component of viral defense system